MEKTATYGNKGSCRSVLILELFKLSEKKKQINFKIAKETNAKRQQILITKRDNILATVNTIKYILCQNNKTV